RPALVLAHDLLDVGVQRIAHDRLEIIAVVDPLLLGAVRTVIHLFARLRLIGGAAEADGPDAVRQIGRLALGGDAGQPGAGDAAGLGYGIDIHHEGGGRAA